MAISKSDRADAERLYVQYAYKEYLNQMKVANKALRVISSIEDEDFAQYVLEHHPRWYDLAHKSEFQLTDVNMKTEKQTMSDLAQKIEMSSVDESGNVIKMVTKKLLKTMTISALKAMISKLFKIEVIA